MPINICSIAFRKCYLYLVPCTIVVLYNSNLSSATSPLLASLILSFPTPTNILTNHSASGLPPSLSMITWPRQGVCNSITMPIASSFFSLLSAQLPAGASPSSSANPSVENLRDPKSSASFTVGGTVAPRLFSILTYQYRYEVPEDARIFAILPISASLLLSLSSSIVIVNIVSDTICYVFFTNLFFMLLQQPYIDLHRRAVFLSLY